jgi:hypothetical protein
MARRPYVYLAGNLSTWAKGFVPTPAALRNLDQYSSEMVNGDDGGTWAPTSPIVIGPHGTPTVTLGNASCALSGDIETVKGNQLDLVLDAKAGLVLQGGNPPAFQSSRTRSATVGFTSFNETLVSPLEVLAYYTLDPRTLGVKMVVASPTALIAVSASLPVRAQHRNATIDSVDFRVLLSGEQLTLPATMPRFRIIRVRAGAVTTLHTVAGAYLADGWLPDPAATLSTYINNGLTRTISYVPNQNNTALDPTTDFYVLQARLVSAGAILLSATVNMSAIADLRQE